MQLECLKALDDKRLRGFGQKKRFISTTRDALFAHIKKVSTQLTVSYLQIHRAAIGREACLKLIRKTSSVQFVLAVDAGKVIERDVQEWMQHKKRPLLRHWFSVDEFGRIFGRDKVSLIALQNNVVFQKISCFSEWKKRLGEVG